MDSEGYRKTITTENLVTLQDGAGPEADRLKGLVLAATKGPCQDVMKTLDFRVDHGTVHIPPIGGWAGRSIVMCTCKPEVEVNLLRVPGISHVAWDEAP
jgi:hypothetical protein